MLMSGKVRQIVDSSGPRRPCPASQESCSWAILFQNTVDIKADVAAILLEDLTGSSAPSFMVIDIEFLSATLGIHMNRTRRVRSMTRVAFIVEHEQQV